MFEGVLELARPFAVGNLLAVACRHTLVVEKASIPEFIDPLQRAVQQTGYLHWCAVARGAWLALVACLHGLAHLVHPCAGIVLIASEDDASVPVDINVDVEAIWFHLAVNGGSGVVLTEVHARGVARQTLMDDIFNARRVFVCSFIIPCKPSVIVRLETSLDFLL